MIIFAKMLFHRRFGALNKPLPWKAALKNFRNCQEDTVDEVFLYLTCISTVYSVINTRSNNLKNNLLKGVLRFYKSCQKVQHKRFYTFILKIQNICVCAISWFSLNAYNLPISWYGISWKLIFLLPLPLVNGVYRQCH